MQSEQVGREVTHDVSPFQALTWSLGAFASGAIMSGAASFVRTTKKLEEDKIDLKLRARGVPVALKAFGISTCMICAVGAVGYLSLTTGMELSNTTKVSTWNSALQEIKQQQDVFRHTFQAKVDELKAKQQG